MIESEAPASPEEPPIARTIRFGEPGDGIPACPACRVAMALHQPDPGRPDRLLGACVRCGRWALIGPGRDGRPVLIAELPDPGRIPDGRP